MSFLSNVGSYLGSQSFVEQFFQGALNTGVGQLQTQQQVSEINAETDKLKAEAELIKQKNLQNQLNAGKKNTLVIVAILLGVAAVGTGIYFYTKKLN